MIAENIIAIIDALNESEYKRLIRILNEREKRAKKDVQKNNHESEIRKRLTKTIFKPRRSS